MSQHNLLVYTKTTVLSPAVSVTRLRGRHLVAMNLAKTLEIGVDLWGADGVPISVG
jgi:hypothetical protein